MTVSSDLNRISYSGNGSTTVFPVNYYFLEDTHLQVILITAAGVETIQTLTTNYTVSGAGNPAGGSVTMLVAPPTGTTIVIQRDVPATQETDYLANDPFPAESHERALDKLTMLAQQNERENGRALKIPLSAVPTTSTELPIPQADKLLGYNSNATAVINIDPADIASLAVASTAWSETFVGNGSNQTFVLSRNPGSVNNIHVSINGATQVPNVDYTLSNNTMTITTAPPLNSVVLARYFEALTFNSGDAQDVRYVPAGSGAVPTNVRDKLRETVSVKDFGAVGDGVTDDTAAIQAAVDSGAKVIDGQGLTYLLSAGIVGVANQKIQNATFTASSLPTNEKMFSWTGVEGTAISLTSNAAENAITAVVASTASFVVDGWAFLKSEAYWSPASSDNVKYGEYVRIKSIDSGTNTLTFYDNIVAGYNTTDSATISPITLKENITLENVNLYGPVSTGNQYGFYFDKCGNVLVNNCHTYDFDHTHISFQRSVGYQVRGGSANRTGVQEGLDYGIGQGAGCYNGLVDGYTANAVRHISTIGGSQGIGRFLRVVNCFAYGCTDAGIDSHTAVYEHEFSHNFVSITVDADTTKEGIIAQGGKFVCIGNTIVNAGRHGIFFQPAIADTFTGTVSAVISGNIIKGNKQVVGTASGVTALSSSFAGAHDITAVTVSDNQIDAFDAAVSITADIGEVNNVVISNNSTLSQTNQRGVRVFAENNGINRVVVANNSFAVGTLEGIYLQGTASGTISNSQISGNLIDGSSSGIRLTYCDNVVTSNNLITNNSGNPRSVVNTTGYMAYDLYGTTVLGDIQLSAVIASGVATIPNPICRILKVDTEGAAATDDLDTINGGYVGQIISVATVTSARDVVCKDGTGNLILSGDITLSHPDDRLVLEYNGTSWFQLSFSDNTA